MFINKSAAARILGYEVTKIWTMPNGAIGAVFVKNGKKCSTLISRKKFNDDFISHRVQGAKNVTVTQWGAGSYRGFYNAASNGKNYTVKNFINGYTCTCADYNEQVKADYKKPLCKHIVATIGFIKSGVSLLDIAS